MDVITLELIRFKPCLRTDRQSVGCNFYPSLETPIVLFYNRNDSQEYEPGDQGPSLIDLVDILGC